MSDLWKIDDDATWSSEKFQLTGGSPGLELPTIARLCEDSNYYFGAEASIDLSKPFLLHSVKRDYNKVICRTLTRGGKDPSGRAVGLPLIIPEDYSGWFSLMTEDGKPKALYRTIEEIAKIRCQYFLVETDIRVYRDDGAPKQKKKESPDIQEEPPEGKESPEPPLSGNDSAEARVYSATVVHAGTIIKAVGIFADEKVNTGKTSPEDAETDAEKTPKKGSYYLRCTNSKDDVIFIPYHREGDFYPIARPNSSNTHKIHTMPNILKVFDLPLTVRLIHGVTPSKFRSLRLLETVKEDVFLACCLSENKRIMLELNTKDKNVKFERLENMDVVEGAELFKSVCSWCKEKSPLYMRQIKVGDTFRTRRAQSSEREKDENTDEHLFYSYVDIGDRAFEDEPQVTETPPAFAGIRALFPLKITKDRVSKLLRRVSRKDRDGDPKQEEVNEKNGVDESLPAISSSDS